jgi:hypothetical protein
MIKRLKVQLEEVNATLFQYQTRLLRIERHFTDLQPLCKLEPQIKQEEGIPPEMPTTEPHVNTTSNLDSQMINQTQVKKRD